MGPLDLNESGEWKYQTRNQTLEGLPERFEQMNLGSVGQLQQTSHVMVVLGQLTFTFPALRDRFTQDVMPQTFSASQDAAKSAWEGPVNSLDDPSYQPPTATIGLVESQFLLKPTQAQKPTQPTKPSPTATGWGDAPNGPTTLDKAGSRSRHSGFQPRRRHHSHLSPERSLRRTFEWCSMRAQINWHGITSTTMETKK